MRFWSKIFHQLVAKSWQLECSKCSSCSTAAQELRGGFRFCTCCALPETPCGERGTKKVVVQAQSKLFPSPQNGSDNASGSLLLGVCVGVCVCEYAFACPHCSVLSERRAELLSTCVPALRLLEEVRMMYDRWQVCTPVTGYKKLVGFPSLTKVCFWEGWWGLKFAPFKREHGSSLLSEGEPLKNPARRTKRWDATIASKRSYTHTGNRCCFFLPIPSTNPISV